MSSNSNADFKSYARKNYNSLVMKLLDWPNDQVTFKCERRKWEITLFMRVSFQSNHHHNTYSIYCHLSPASSKPYNGPWLIWDLTVVFSCFRLLKPTKQKLISHKTAWCKLHKTGNLCHYWSEKNFGLPSVNLICMLLLHLLYLSRRMVGCLIILSNFI